MLGIFHGIRWCNTDLKVHCKHTCFETSFFSQYSGSAPSQSCSVMCCCHSPGCHSHKESRPSFLIKMIAEDLRRHAEDERCSLLGDSDSARVVSCFLNLYASDNPFPALNNPPSHAQRQTGSKIVYSTFAVLEEDGVCTCSSPMRLRSQTMSRLSAPQDASIVSFLGLQPIYRASTLVL